MFNINPVIDEKRACNMNTIVLAFIGDAVFTLYVREKLALASDKKVSDLHKETASIIRAGSQADLFDELSPKLTETELNIFKRARNSKKGTKAKSATVGEYNKSTGFEAVVGYLYITGQSERLDLLLDGVCATTENYKGNE